MKPSTPRGLVACLFTAMALSAQPYSAVRASEDGVEIVRLRDEASDTTVSIAPTVGNIAYEMKVKGENVFWFPFQSVAAFAAKPKLCGNPLLWPWANRLDEDGFWADGVRYALNPELGNFRRDPSGLPIHGLLAFRSEWEVARVEASGNEASATSRLEYYRYPDLAQQFPFAHAIEMSYRLSKGELTITTRIENLGRRPMPVSLGYHPYFQLPGVPRDEWTVRLAARKLWKLDKRLLPTGETEPLEPKLSPRERFSLKNAVLDHVFGDLIRDADGRARFRVEGGGRRIEIAYGERFDTAIVYSPGGEGREFICFEPMAGITNAMNLAERGVFHALQTIPPGGVWQESFSVLPSGF